MQRLKLLTENAYPAQFLAAIRLDPEKPRKSANVNAPGIAAE